MTKHFFAIVAVLIISCNLLSSAIPQKISYQGVLKNSSTGIVVPDDVYSVTFKLYSVASGGTEITKETQIITVTQGYFNTEISLPNSYDFNNQLYLGVTYNGSEMTPRVALNVVPYANLANNANNATNSNTSNSTNALRGNNVSTTTPKAGDMLVFDGTNWVPKKQQVAVCRWNVFDTFEANDASNYPYAFSDNESFFAGIKPSAWNTSNPVLTSITNDKSVLSTFFNRKCFAKKNALIYDENFYVQNLLRAKVVMALIRIKNNTSLNADWSISFYYTGYTSGSYSNNSYLFVNGTKLWNSNVTGSTSYTISLQPGINTIIVISGSGTPRSITSAPAMRTCRLAFYNDCLGNLPSGCEFIDDLDED